MATGVHGRPVADSPGPLFVLQVQRTLRGPVTISWQTEGSSPRSWLLLRWSRFLLDTGWNPGSLTSQRHAPGGLFIHS